MPDLIKRVNFFDHLFNAAETQSLECKIFFDNFCTYFSLKKEDKIIVLQVFDHKSKNINTFNDDDFKLFELLNYKYKEITIFCTSQKNTLIPTDVFDKFNVEQYIKFNFQSLENEVVLFDDLSELGIANVYSINQNSLRLFKNLIPEAAIRSQNSVLLKHFYIHNNQKQNLYVNTRQDCFDCIAFNEKGLLFSNTYYYNSAQDYIFYLMNVVKQLALDPENLVLFLSGEIEKDGAIYNFIFKYIRNINFIQKPIEMEWPLEDVPYHYFFNILKDL